MLNSFFVRKIVLKSLEEDIGICDLTTNSIFQDEESSAILIAKEFGVIAGIDIASCVFKTLDSSIIFKEFVKDGEKVVPKQKIAEIQGKTKTILTAERVALNFLQRLSGIATLTANYVDTIKEFDCQILDTRKTTPGLRAFEKYAVKVGGGTNHRLTLDNAVMIKDNHISACGSILEAVKRVRKNIPMTTKIEVETTNFTQIEEALQAKVDIIMLDNMSPKEMKKAVEMIDEKALVEASGGITLEGIREVAKTGVDYISVGALTHSAKALDISLNIY